METEDLVRKLNRVIRLYERATQEAKPHRFYRMKKIYREISEHAFRNYNIVSLDSLTEYELLLGPQPALAGLIIRKEEAVRAAEYETAAALRDQEKVYIDMMIRQAGMNADEHFFLKEGVIFFKHW
jgi:hypothetical protein